MTCRAWSLTADKAFTGLCSMEMQSESTTKTLTCKVCVRPGACTEGCQYVWTESGWVMVSNCCPAGTSPTPPLEDATTIGETAAGTCT